MFQIPLQNLLHQFNEIIDDCLSVTQNTVESINCDEDEKPIILTPLQHLSSSTNPLSKSHKQTEWCDVCPSFRNPSSSYES